LLLNSVEMGSEFTVLFRYKNGGSCSFCHHCPLSDNRAYFAVKIDGYRSNGSKVTAFCIYSIDGVHRLLINK